MSSLHLTDRASMKLHKSVGKPVLVRDVELVCYRAMNVTLTRHAHG